MVAVNFRVNQIGTVAVFATLFVAISVNGEKECVLNFEHGDTDFDFRCSQQKLWAVKDLESESGIKKALTLQPTQEGCLRTKNTVSLNADSAVACRLLQSADDHENVTLTLKPKEGTCPQREQCVWNISKDPQYKTKKWVTLEHKFPISTSNEYYLELNVGKTKGEFYLDHITVPGGSMNKCQKSGRSSDVSSGKENLKEEEEEAEELPSQLGQTGNATTEKSLAPGLVDLRKNLMLTSASVLTLNHLLN